MGSCQQEGIAIHAGGGIITRGCVAPRGIQCSLWVRASVFPG